MKAIILTGFGGYDKMELRSMEYPQVSSDGVIVEIKACGLNFSDIHNRQGIFTFHDVQPPFVLGAEGAGVIHKIGSNVTNFKVGDRVMCWNFHYGIWAEYVSLPAPQCRLIPDSMTFEQAASITINYVTAYFAVLDFGGIKSGQSLLIQAAAGGVGWAATQLANSVPNVTVFGTSSSAKHNHIKENGVTHAIDYHRSDFVTEVLHISPKGVNVVLDCLSGHDFTRSRSILKPMGRIIHMGISNAVTGECKSLLNLFKVWWYAKDIKVIDLIHNNSAVCGLNLANLHEDDPKTFNAALDHILNLFVEGKVKPRIDSVWTFDQVTQAQKRMMGRKNIGKIILVPKATENEQI